uniref:Uncharacterized protein n=1 Tax=Rhizophora mucronata TaxID=61149 RepID=A0A2P2QRG9_RHIMU
MLAMFTDLYVVEELTQCFYEYYFRKQFQETTLTKSMDTKKH